MSDKLRKLSRACWRPLAETAARAYVAGPTLADALQSCLWFSRKGFSSTVCYWNGQKDNPREVADRYLASLDLLAREKIDCYLSVKAPALGFSRDLLSEVLDRARSHQTGVHFDSLGPETVERTFSLIAESRSRYADLGCTLPGRWRRSLRDAERAVELGLRVRVVKGQWEDQDGDGTDPREGFLAVAKRLAGRARHVAVATHDVPLAVAALQTLREAGTSCELELLYGLPQRRPLRAARAAGVAARLYVSYGHGCLPYNVRQARKNPLVLWWFFHDLLSGFSFRAAGASAAGRRLPFLTGNPKFNRSSAN